MAPLLPAFLIALSLSRWWMGEAAGQWPRLSRSCGHERGGHAPEEIGIRANCREGRRRRHRKQSTGAAFAPAQRRARSLGAPNVGYAHKGRFGYRISAARSSSNPRIRWGVGERCEPARSSYDAKTGCPAVEIRVHIFSASSTGPTSVDTLFGRRPQMIRTLATAMSQAVTNEFHIGLRRLARSYVRGDSI